MPNRQPPNDPNLERDLWGEDDRLDRPVIDLTPKSRHDRDAQDDRPDLTNPTSQLETSNWDDEGETSNWDDADDYDREYDDIPSDFTRPTPEAPRETLGQDVESIAKREPGTAAATMATTGRSDSLDVVPGGDKAESVGNPAPLSPTSVSEITGDGFDNDPSRAEEDPFDRHLSDDVPPDPPDEGTGAGAEANADSVQSVPDQSGEEPTYRPETSAIVTPAVQEPTETIEALTPDVLELTEPETQAPVAIEATVGTQQERRPIDVDIDTLSTQAADLRREIAQLQAQKTELQADLSRLVRESLQDLSDRRQELQTAVEKLERRQARIQEEMQTTFAGASQDLAVRVQGFKEYLVGSLQDLSLAAERLQLAPNTSPGSRTANAAPRDSTPPTARPTINQATRPTSGQSRPPRPIAQDPSRDRGTPFTAQPPQLSSPSLRTQRSDRPDQSERLGQPNLADRRDRPDRNTEDPSFGKKGFQDQASFIRSTLDRYRDQPDYYGPPWQLRRTFQPVQAERVSDWFFNQSGRGVVRSMGSRLQNILIASTTISILRGVYDKRLRTLVLANSPERLGEWRRGLQDCLGITRNDFGPDRGITLFEDPMLMAQKAERLVKAGWLPLIVMDESEAQLNLSLLQFPLWLAFAADPSRSSSFDRDWMVR